MIKNDIIRYKEEECFYEKREIVAVILLSIFTCGIYTIYWYYVVAQDLNKEDPNDELMNYILAMLLGIITCGIYLIYWTYLFYRKIDKVTGSDNWVLSFILSLFGFEIVSQAVAQDSINKKLDSKVEIVE